MGKKTFIIYTYFHTTSTMLPTLFIFIHGGLQAILIAQIVMAIIISAMTAAFQITVSELFPTAHRYSGMSAAYNLGNAIFAGTTPMIAVWLTQSSGSEYGACIYLAVSSIITLLLINKMPETRSSKDLS